MTIALGSDHAGFEYKEAIKAFLKEQGYNTADMGPYNEESVDYPDFAHPVAEQVASKSSELGIVFCGSGNGVAMTVNKHAHIRAALAWTPQIAALARQHNNANILAIPARFVGIDETKAMITAYLDAEFEGGRHARRVGKIPCM